MELAVGVVLAIVSSETLIQLVKKAMVVSGPPVKSPPILSAE